MASQTQLVPYSELGPGQAARIRNDIVGKLIEVATKALDKTEDKLVVRDIRPYRDIAIYTAGAALAAEDWGCVTGTTANAYETMATGTMADVTWVGIYGVIIGELCSCTQLKFNIGGGDRAIWSLQSLRSQDDWVGITQAGILIPQNTPYTISRYVRSPSNQAYIVLKGVVVEPRGVLISP